MSAAQKKGEPEKPRASVPDRKNAELADSLAEQYMGEEKHGEDDSVFQIL